MTPMARARRCGTPFVKWMEKLQMQAMGMLLVNITKDGLKTLNSSVDWASMRTAFRFHGRASNLTDKAHGMKRALLFMTN